MKKIKVPIGNLTEKDLAKIKQVNINKAKAIVSAMPFATPTYVALKTGLPIKFIIDNRIELGI